MNTRQSRRRSVESFTPEKCKAIVSDFNKLLDEFNNGFEENKLLWRIIKLLEIWRFANDHIFHCGHPVWLEGLESADKIAHMFHVKNEQIKREMKIIFPHPHDDMNIMSYQLYKTLAQEIERNDRLMNL
jgi:hypothetical protein